MSSELRLLVEDLRAALVRLRKKKKPPFFSTWAREDKEQWRDDRERMKRLIDAMIDRLAELTGASSVVLT